MTPQKLDTIIAKTLILRAGMDKALAKDIARQVRAEIDLEIDLEEGDGGGQVGGERAAAPARAVYPDWHQLQRSTEPTQTVGLDVASDNSIQAGSIQSQAGRISGPPSLLPMSPSVSPATDRPRPSLLVIPDRREVDAFERTGKVQEPAKGVVFSISDKQAAESEELARKQAREAGGGDPEIEYWTLPEMVKILSENTPDHLKVIPEGRTEPIDLVRNVQCVVLMKGVKLIYFHPLVQSEAIMAKDQPVRLGLQAVVDFYQNQREIQITLAMDQMAAQAKRIFGIRQRDVVSHTPVKTGTNLTVDLAGDPHVAADKQQYNGRWI